MLIQLEQEMLKAAKNLEFEKAASLRDRMEEVLALISMSREQPKRKRKGGRKRWSSRSR